VGSEKLHAAVLGSISGHTLRSSELAVQDEVVPCQALTVVRREVHRRVGHVLFGRHLGHNVLVDHMFKVVILGMGED